MAAIRGDQLEARLWLDAAALVTRHQIDSETELGPLVTNPPPGTGSDLMARLRYVADAGAWVLLESAIADLPADLRWLFESGAVTIEQLAALHSGLGVTSAGDLAGELAREAVRTVPGLDATAEAAIAAAMPKLRGAVPYVPLGRAVGIVEPIMAGLTQAGAEWAAPVGSLRRGHDMIGDIEIVAPLANPTPALDAIASLADVSRILHRGERRIYVLLGRVQVGVRIPHPDTAGAELLSLTGSREHLRQLAGLAAERGWTLDRRGLVKNPGDDPIARRESDIYAALGLPLIPPEIRNGEQEIVAARNGVLPELVSRPDIRGDLHMHTRWSDGRDSVEDMVRAAAALGYEYIAITDHSPNAAASRTLAADGVARQTEEIAALRERYPQIVILHGCEVDIMADGRLDFSDATLERFDIVLASLHDRAGHTPEQLMRRYITAMRHPLVTLITHPTNRLVPHRAGYDLDYDHLFESAVETRTVVEIDGSPAHLDLDGALARRAIAAGATVAIDSDSHRADMLDRQMQLGLTMARRGWVEPRHVLNGRSIEEVRAFITAKRRG